MYALYVHAGMSSITVSPMPTPTATMDTTMTPLGM